MVDHSGIGSTIRGFLDHLTKEQFARLVLISKPGWKNPYPCQVIEVPYPIYSLSSHWAYSKFLNNRRPVLFHMPHYDVPYFLKRPFVATVHDLIHFRFPQYSTQPFSKLYSGLLLKHVVGRARKIITVSNNTKADLIQTFPKSADKIVVIYPGIDDGFKPAPEIQIQTVLNKFNLKKGYLLYVGNLRASKNTTGLIEAYLSLRKTNPEIPQLVLVGKNSLKNFKDNFPPGILHLGEVNHEDLPSIYSGASIFIFPSLYEGFGLPPLEAMACGVPVIVSNRASMPEVCAQAAFFVNPESLESIREGMTTLLNNPNMRKELVQKGFKNINRFSWESFTQKSWAVYENILGESVSR
ncbi:MAG: glycosyltransferase family 4 protein [Elusimicrobia bacterium]|nr:glycosyltransferase family 4 protein [Candidatus Obscuribacterium magneticum]